MFVGYSSRVIEQKQPRHSLPVRWCIFYLPCHSRISTDLSVRSTQGSACVVTHCSTSAKCHPTNISIKGSSSFTFTYIFFALRLFEIHILIVIYKNKKKTCSRTRLLSAYTLCMRSIMNALNKCNKLSGSLSSLLPLLSLLL